MTCPHSRPQMFHRWPHALWQNCRSYFVSGRYHCVSNSSHIFLQIEENASFYIRLFKGHSFVWADCRVRCFDRLFVLLNTIKSCFSPAHTIHIHTIHISVDVMYSKSCDDFHFAKHPYSK